MKRTAELVLSILGTVFNFLSVGVLIVTLLFFQWIITDPLFLEDWDDEFEYYDDDYYSSEQYEEDMELIMESGIMGIVNGIGWFFAILGIIGAVLSIIAIIKLKTNTKLAGILLIISSVLSGLITLAGILLMIAGIMCLVRKPKKDIETIRTDENGYIIE